LVGGSSLASSADIWRSRCAISCCCLRESNSSSVIARQARIAALWLSTSGPAWSTRRMAPSTYAATWRV
jgi:hypothetical protein